MSTLQILNMEQRSEAWYAARCGIVTASVVGKLVTPKTVQPASNDESRGVIAALAAERATNCVEPTFANFDMQRGVDAEPFARDLYGKHHAPAVECGFMIRDFGDYLIGYSPDGLVGDDGLIEVKSPRQKGHLMTVVADAVPTYYMAQLQAGLLVSGRKWIDYVSYSPGMPLWVRRVLPDGRWFDAITEAAELAEKAICEQVAKYEAAVAGLPHTERIDFFEEVS